MTRATTAHDRMLIGRDVASRLATSAGADAAFLAGSTVVGLGNGASDLDVYLVGDRLSDTRRQMFADDIRIDVQHLTTETLTTVVDRVLEVELRSDRAGAAVSDRDVALVVRLWTGDVVTDAGSVTALRERLAADPLRLRRLVINSWVLSAFFAVEDLAGLWHSDDPLDADASALTGRQALIAAGKALAAASGDLYYGEKWVWRQVARSVPDSFPFNEFRRLLRHDPLLADPRDGLTQLVSFAQTCLIAAATLGWHGVPLEHWPSWLDDGGPLRRAELFLPRAYDDAVVIIGPTGRHVRMAPDVALVWGLCNGCPRTASPGGRQNCA